MPSLKSPHSFNAPDAMPDIRGRLRQNIPLGPRTWFRTGGNAEWLFIPEDVEDLSYGLCHLPPDIPLTILGACSNLIIRDGGIEGVIIRLTGRFAAIEHDQDGIIAGAAVLDATLAEYAAQYGLDNLAFLCGIPGSIGGAIAMNAGAYGKEISDVLDWVECMSRDGKIERLHARNLPMHYRHGGLPEGSIVLRARFKTRTRDKREIAAQMADIRRQKEESQPLHSRTGGSTFRNPEGHKAWELIDKAGCRGLRKGDAQMSEKHCNFMLNLGQANSTELEELGEEVRKRVKEKSGVILQWEIKRIGKFLK